MSKASDQLAAEVALIESGRIDPANCEAHGIDRGHYYHLLAILGISAPVLSPGTNVVGKVGIDQTTPGVTNKVDATTPGALTDRSGTITTGGTAQQLAAAMAARRYFLLQNNSDTGAWFNFGVVAVASQPSIFLAAGASYENPAHFCPSGFVSIIGATTGKIFTAKEA